MWAFENLYKSTLTADAAVTSVGSSFGRSFRSLAPTNHVEAQEMHRLCGGLPFWGCHEIEDSLMSGALDTKSDAGRLE